ncbi:DUF4230 domain-containing protein [Campylobacter sp. FMV-PI01]|uniref:DUF4230 domain-containing protein n=1 Tax=Campylobacter portucalensis TaxID=2608384 RepID=A0A6L5WM31_9BACT|nr:DUF4230 domain-containing protein [Campylobacter portucalensis]MSN97055.1 DUF4230 domain-containing protein [Campylobacter portucalensis]
MEIVFSILVMALLAVIFVLLRQNKKLNSSPSTEISTSITKLKSIGELSVFKIYSKEIVTKKDSAIGGFWDKIFGWSMSKKQIALIFEFEINFIYDLRSKEFEIKHLNDNSYKITMPPCKYEFSIKDMKIYDEKNSKFLPFLLPDSLSGLFGPGFSESDKNALINEAKDEVKNMSVKIIDDLEKQIHKSAILTLETIARSFGADDLEFEFKDSEKMYVKDSKVEIDRILQKQLSN